MIKSVIHIIQDKKNNLIIIHKTNDTNDISTNTENIDQDQFI